jgi:ribose/xylose/arabinose/galactoside ABC-type transport system permease subunit
MLVHVVWEVLLLLGLVAAVTAAFVGLPDFRSAQSVESVLRIVTATGVVAMAFSLSLRAAVPNLAVTPLAALSAAVFAAAAPHVGVAAGVLQGLGAAAAVGLVLAVLVTALRVPAWAAGVAAGLLAGGIAIAVSPAARAVEGTPHLGSWTYGAAGSFVVLSIGAGLLCLVPGVRRTVGAYRDGQGLAAGLIAAAALVVSSVVAAVGGLVLVFLSGGVVDSPVGIDLWLPLAAVFVGGASAYGRRVGIAGTVLGVLLLVTVRQVWFTIGAAGDIDPFGVALALAGVAAVVGLLATPLVEWAGRRAEARAST